MKKELEALKRVVSEISNYKLHGIGNENWLGIQDVLKDVDTIEKALTPPTAEEVCKALSEETGNSVYYENGKFYVHSVLWHNALSLDTLSKKSISLIGRFYEGEKDK